MTTQWPFIGWQNRTYQVCTITFLLKYPTIQQTKPAAWPLSSSLLPPLHCVCFGQSQWSASRYKFGGDQVEVGSELYIRCGEDCNFTPLATIFTRQLCVSMCKILPFGITWFNSVGPFYTSTITNNNLNCIITCYSFLKTPACFRVQEGPDSPKYRALSHVFWVGVSQ